MDNKEQTNLYTVVREAVLKMIPLFPDTGLSLMTIIDKLEVVWHDLAEEGILVSAVNSDVQ